VDFHGLPFAMETPAGAIRRGIGADGKPWEVEMPVDYGRIARTEGADGEQVDAFIGDDLDSQHAFVIDQIDPDTPAWDEDKVMLGFKDWQAARAAYDDSFSDGRGLDRIGNVTPMSLSELKTWLAAGDTHNPIGQIPLALPESRPTLAPEATGELP